MLGARSERLLAGESRRSTSMPRLARLLQDAAPPERHDAGLVEEVRQLVIARNERRFARVWSRSTSTPRSTRTLEELDAVNRLGHAVGV